MDVAGILQKKLLHSNPKLRRSYADPIKLIKGGSAQLLPVPLLWQSGCFFQPILCQHKFLPECLLQIVKAHLTKRCHYAVLRRCGISQNLVLCRHSICQKLPCRLFFQSKLKSVFRNPDHLNFPLPKLCSQQSGRDSSDIFFHFHSSSSKMQAIALRS